MCCRGCLYKTLLVGCSRTGTPLILSTSGGMGPECAIFVKLLAKKIAQKKNQDQADVMRVLRTEIRFAVLKATLIAIRGTRGSLYQKKDDDTTDVDYNLVALDCDRNEE